MSRSYADKDLKLLWGLAAARCAFTDCRELLVAEATAADGAATLGGISHIVAHSNTGPRSDPQFPESERRKYPNLILLCDNHHRRVDVQPNTYTCDDLRGWKQRHETWVRDSLAAEVQEVGFAQLEVVARAIATHPMPPVTNFTATPPAKKMERNGLTEQVGLRLNVGYMKVRDVEAFVQCVSGLDAAFPEALKAGFVARYDALRGEGLDGDALFVALHEFASSGRWDFERQAAGLAVLVYLFDKCEVFES
jgi:hypothetical protein